MKNPILSFFLILPVVFILFKCQSGREGSHATIVNVNGNKVINCNISQVTDTIDVSLSDLIKHCEVIQLETNDSSLFRSIYHASISDNYIAIHSRGQMPIKLFNRQGKFIRNIGAIGRGPGEFTSLYGIQLDEPANRLYLTPFANASELIVYDIQGVSQKPISLIYKQTKCQTYVENEIVTVLSMPFNDEIPPAYQQSIDGELIQKHPVINHMILRPDFSSEISSSYNAAAYDRFVLAFGNQEPDTLYHYVTEVNKLVPKCVVSFSDKKHGYWSYELKNHYYTIVFGDKYKGRKVIVDKETLKSDFFNIVNDFYGGFRINKFYMSNNGMFISSISPFELIEELESALKRNNLSSKERKKIENLRNSMDENGNEVMFIGKMR